MYSSVLVWISVLVRSNRELYPLHTDVRRQRWLSNLDSSRHLSANLSIMSCLLHFEQVLSYPALCKGNFICPQTQVTLLPYWMCHWESFTPHNAVDAFIREQLHKLSQTQCVHSPGYHQANRVHPSDENMGHSNYCQRPRSHSAYNNIVWKTIETWVQVIKPPEDERISYRFQSSDLPLIEPISRHFSSTCPWLSPYVLLKFPIRKQNAFQSWDENTFWDCNFTLQMLRCECCCGVPRWEKKGLCDWGEKVWASCFLWATQIRCEPVQSSPVFS